MFSTPSGKSGRRFVGFLLLMAFLAGLIIGVPLGAWISRRAWMDASHPALSSDAISETVTIVETEPHGSWIAAPATEARDLQSPANSLEADILRELEKRIPKPVLPDTDVPGLQAGQTQTP
ncbi:MAG: hypothetical protein JW706_11940 [Opitutales bacterium]|nr:hypothetical protein [Opitutales bacterium]